MKHLEGMGKILNLCFGSLSVGMWFELVTFHRVLNLNLNCNDGKWNLLDCNSKKFNKIRQRRNKMDKNKPTRTYLVLYLRFSSCHHALCCLSPFWRILCEVSFIKYVILKLILIKYLYCHSKSLGLLRFVNVFERRLWCSSLNLILLLRFQKTFLF